MVEQMDLERYYDIYDISALDLAEAALGYAESEFDDLDSLRALKLLTSRFFIIRKAFLCCLLALDARGGKGDYVRWNAAADEIRALDRATISVEKRLHQILDEEQSEFGLFQAWTSADHDAQAFPCRLLLNFLHP